MKAVRHIGIVVTDLKKALHFYRDLLGLKIVNEIDESGNFIDSILSIKNVVVKTIKMKADDGNIVELLYFKSHLEKSRDRSINEVGCSHTAFMVESIDKEYKRLKENGVIFNSLPRISPDGYAKVAFCRDPDGTFIELVEVLQK